MKFLLAIAAAAILAGCQTDTDPNPGTGLVGLPYAAEVDGTDYAISDNGDVIAVPQGDGDATGSTDTGE